MEAHPECSICCHKLIVKDDTGKKQNYSFPDINGDHIFDKNFLYEHAFIRTCSVVFQNKRIKGLQDLLKNFQIGDSPLFYYYAQLGDIGYIDDIMSVYRLHDNSSWSSQPAIEQVKGTLDTRIKQRKFLKITNSRTLNHVILNYIIQVIKYYSKIGDEKSVREYLILAYKNLRKANKAQVKNILKYSIKTYFPIFYRFIN